MIVAVSGFGRCGTSLATQMLYFGGLRCVGRFPAFEDYDGEWPVRDPAGFVAEAEGKAVKILDPMRWPLPAGPEYKVIWLDRNHREQARSALKMVALTFPSVDPNDRGAVKRMARSYKRDRPRALAALRRVDADILEMTFEDLIRRPFDSAALIAAHVGGGLDADAMGRVPLARNVDCRPDLLIERTLIGLAEQAEARAAARAAAEWANAGCA